MRSSRYSIAVLVAIALAACGEEGGKNKGDGGSGGGAGGSGGTGGDAVVDCGGVRVLELDGSTVPAVLDNTLDTLDNWAPSCAPEDSTGNDVVVHFRAGEAGFYRFRTEAEFDTVLAAYADCNDGFSQQKCNDDANGGKQSQLLLELAAGEEAFIVVDSVGVRSAQPFKLTADRVVANAPAITEMEAFTNDQQKTTGVVLSGTNPDSPVVAFSLQLYGSNGAALLQQPFEARFDEVQILTVTQDAGAFEVVGSFFLGANAPHVAKVELAMIDENGLVGEAVSADTQDPVLLERGAPCDPALARSICPETDACVTRDEEVGPVCAVATAPTVDAESALVYVNLEEFLWGVVVEGNDPESDAVYVRVLPRKESGAGISVGETGPTTIPFYRIGHDENGNFRGVMLLRAIFDGPCLPPANAAYQACVQGGGSQQACYDEAVALLEQCYKDTLAEVATVDIEVMDQTGRLSEKLEVAVTPSPAVEEGGACDAYDVTGICPEGNVCWAEGEDYEPETCHATGPACPDDWGVVDLMDHASGDRWVFEGSNAEAEARGRASCGGGGPTQVLSFTAPAAGTYAFATAKLGDGVDTVVSVREYCQLPAYEIACNDDNGVSSTASRAEVELEADQTVFVLVDVAEGAVAGSYQLTVTGP